MVKVRRTYGLTVLDWQTHHIPVQEKNDTSHSHASKQYGTSKTKTRPYPHTCDTDITLSLDGFTVIFIPSALPDTLLNVTPCTLSFLQQPSARHVWLSVDLSEMRNLGFGISPHLTTYKPGL